MADEDGSLAAVDRQHRNRKVALHEDFDGSWQLIGGFGSAQGAVIAEVLAAFEAAELEADWQQARCEHGEQATVEHLARTAMQRRADALASVFTQAASVTPGGQRALPLVNIVMSYAEWECALARAFGAGSAADAAAKVGKARCSTLEGHVVHPAEAVAAALVGHARRVVLAADGTVINLGRKVRLFCGSAREAALLANHGCVWPGCDQVGRRNQIDHLIEWRHGGSTDQDNATTLCRFHNRFKSSHHIKVWRDVDGVWHTNQPGVTRAEINRPRGSVWAAHNGRR